MTEMKIMADAGHVAWDMERFQFLDKQDEFDSIHPSLHRISKLNNNYGLYEVIPGIYQVRGFDLSDITLRPRQDRLDRLRPAGHRRDGARGLEAVPGARRRGPAGLGGDLLPHPWRPLGRRARHRGRGGCAVGQGPGHRARRLHGLHRLGERLRRQRHEPAALLPVRPAAAGRAARLSSGRGSARASRPAPSG